MIGVWKIRVSPLYGAIHHLPEIAIFVGTDEIFYPDCEKLRLRFAMEGRPLRYYVYPKMFHDWALFPHIKETRNLMSQLVEFIDA